MTRRKVSLDSLLKRYKPHRRAVRRWLWRNGTLRTWLLNPQPEGTQAGKRSDAH